MEGEEVLLVTFVELEKDQHNFLQQQSVKMIAVQLSCLALS